MPVRLLDRRVVRVLRELPGRTRLMKALPGSDTVPRPCPRSARPGCEASLNGPWAPVELCTSSLSDLLCRYVTIGEVVLVAAAS
jgi:hypothetical protein